MSWYFEISCLTRLSMFTSTRSGKFSTNTTLPESIATSSYFLKFASFILVIVRPWLAYYILSHGRACCCGSIQRQYCFDFCIISALSVLILSPGKPLACHSLTWKLSPKSSWIRKFSEQVSPLVTKAVVYHLSTSYFRKLKINAPPKVTIAAAKTTSPLTV